MVPQMSRRLDRYWPCITPRAHVFHGSEHVLGLYFSDVAKLPHILVRHVVDCHLSLLTTGVSHLTLNFFFAGSNIKNLPLIQRVWLWFKSWDLRGIHYTDHEFKWGKGHWPTKGCRDQVCDLVLCNASRTTFGRSSPCYCPRYELFQSGHCQDKQSRHAYGEQLQVKIILACSLHPVAMCLSCP